MEQKRYPKQKKTKRNLYFNSKITLNCQRTTNTTKVTNEGPDDASVLCTFLNIFKDIRK